jgi:Lar family restriction alleviation protein
MMIAKRCPFCGGKAVSMWGQVYWYACPACKAETRGASTKEEALAIWNRRVKIDNGFPVEIDEPDSASIPDRIIDWDKIESDFEEFCKTIHADEMGISYERSAAIHGGKWMRHLILLAMRGRVNES